MQSVILLEEDPHKTKEIKSHSISCWIRSEQSPATVGRGSFAKQKSTGSDQKAANALIRELAVDVGFYYLALMEAHVRTQIQFLTHTHTHTQQHRLIVIGRFCK